MESLTDNPANVFWPMANPPPLPDNLDELKDSDIDKLVEDWLERALLGAMPECVQSIFFTVISPGHSRMNTDVRMILRYGEMQRDLAARFAQMVAYNIQNKASLLQAVHFSDQPIGRTAIFLTADGPEVTSCDPPRHTALALARFNGTAASGWISDESSLQFEGRRVSIRDTAANAKALPSTFTAPSTIVESYGQNDVTSCLLDVTRNGVSAPLYRAHVWPLLEAANVLLVMSPAFHIPDERQRQRVGSCGLNLMLSRGQSVHPSLIETALQLARQLDSLFGTVQNLHHAQTRRHLTYEALNTISHSLKNRANRLADTYPGCSRDLHIQKISSQGAGQIEPHPALVYDSDNPVLWKTGGFAQESITSSLRTCVWAARPSWRMDLSPLEGRLADARWVTLMEELMENLRKWNDSSEPAEIEVRPGQGGKTASIHIRGTVWPEQWQLLNRKIKVICDEGDAAHFKGMNAVLAMVQRLATEGTNVEYHCGLAGTEPSAKEFKKYSLRRLPVTLTRWSDFLPCPDFLPFSALITDLSLPLHD